MARPTKWSEELEEKAIHYADVGWQQVDHVFPSVVGLCDYINVGKSTIYRWADDDIGRFRDILSKINEKQELIAFDRGLRGDYNASLVKLLLGKHGYHEKQDREITGRDGDPLEVDMNWSIEIVE